MKQIAKRALRRVLGFYLFQSRRVWNHLPRSLRSGLLGRVYGRHLHGLVCGFSQRKQNHSTFFLRNRPELELMRRLLGGKALGSGVDISVLACSKGAEVYSILWTIRSARPDLKVRLEAIDISEEILQFAREGVYSLRPPPKADGLVHTSLEQTGKVSWNTYRDQGPEQNVSIFVRMTKQEVSAMFDLEGEEASVKPWLREGITWRSGDASDPDLMCASGAQDVVVANRFLCHMDPVKAENCLRNIAKMVKPGGYLFVSGIDLDVRARVARDLRWEPVTELIREVHEGDPSLCDAWPMEWWGLEPFSEDLPDWKLRYAAAFQMEMPATGSPTASGDYVK